MDKYSTFFSGAEETHTQILYREKYYKVTWKYSIENKSDNDHFKIKTKNPLRDDFYILPDLVHTKMLKLSSLELNL